MSAVEDAVAVLREIRPRLLKPSTGGIEGLRLADDIRRLRELLAREEPRWIGSAEAGRLLAIELEDSVAYWVRHGLLRGRFLPDGRIEVTLDDVLRKREEIEELTAIDQGEDRSWQEIQRRLPGGSGKRHRGRQKADAAR